MWRGFKQQMLKKGQVSLLFKEALALVLSYKELKA